MFTNSFSFATPVAHRPSDVVWEPRMIDLPSASTVDEVKRYSVDKAEVRENARSADTPLEKALIYADAAGKQKQVGFRYKLDLLKAATEAFQESAHSAEPMAWTEWAMFVAQSGGSINEIEALTSRARKAGAEEMPELWQRWVVWVILHFQQPDCVKKVAPETRHAKKLLPFSRLIWEGQYDLAMQKLGQISALSANNRELLQARILRLQGSCKEALELLEERDDLEALLERGKAGDGTALEDAYRQTGIFPYVAVPYIWALAPKIGYEEDVGMGHGRMELPSKYRYLSRAASSASNNLLLARICGENDHFEEATFRADEVISEAQLGGSQAVACYWLLRDWEQNSKGRVEAQSVVAQLPDNALSVFEREALDSVIED